MIEPILIAVMGAAVGGMVIALYLPLFNIINLVQ
jgi:type IV pilus assembly protein PilC